MGWIKQLFLLELCSIAKETLTSADQACPVLWRQGEEYVYWFAVNGLHRTSDLGQQSK